MRQLARMITSVSIAMLWAGSIVHAQGQVENLRMSKQPDYDRIVLDLGVDDVEARQNVTPDEFVLELDATKPELPLATEDKLADLRIYFETSSGGSRVVVDRAGRSVRVFRLEGDTAAGKGDRLVLDVGRTGGSTLIIPPDATPVPDGSRVAETPKPPVRETPRAEPPRQEEDPLVGLDTPVKPAPPKAPETPKSAGPAPTTPAPSTPSGDGPPDGEDVWVLVRAIEIEGVKDSPSLSELRDLKLPVSPVAGGYVAPRGDQPVQRIPLGSLTGDDRNGRKLSGSVLQLIVETIAAAYARNEKLGTKVDIRRADLDNLFSPDSDGRLVIRVREASERSAASR